MNIVLDVLRYLNEHNITLAKAAETTGVAQQNIKKSIGNNPKASTLLALAKGLGIDPRDFFYDLDNEEEAKKETYTNSQNSETPTSCQPNSNTLHTTTFCPHCGAKVRVGIVLLPE